MSMVLANLWKSKVILKQLVPHKNLIQIRIMSFDRKRTGQENNTDDEGKNSIFCHYIKLNNVKKTLCF